MWQVTLCGRLHFVALLIAMCEWGMVRELLMGNGRGTLNGEW